MNVTRSIIIDAPLNKVWQTAAYDFDKIGDWASLVESSDWVDKPAPAKIDGPESAGRVCTTPFGESFELFEMYDEKNHTFRYTAQVEKQPPSRNRHTLLQRQTVR